MGPAAGAGAARMQGADADGAVQDETGGRSRPADIRKGKTKAGVSGETTKNSLKVARSATYCGEISVIYRRDLHAIGD